MSLFTSGELVKLKRVSAVRSIGLQHDSRRWSENCLDPPQISLMREESGLEIKSSVWVCYVPISISVSPSCELACIHCVVLEGQMDLLLQ